MIAYLDASAVVKLMLQEPETDELRSFVRGCEPVSSEIVVTEVLRAAQRGPISDAAARGDLVESAMGAMEELTLVMAQTSTFARAGMIDGHHLRSLDAIHIATAQGIDCVDIFVTYDDRQAAAARLAGFATISPGA